MSWIAIVAGISFGLALALLAAFFVTSDQRYDRVAEWCFGLFAVAMVPTMLTVADLLATLGLAGTALTIIGVLSVAIIGIGEVGSSLGLIDFRRVAMVITAAFVGFLAWIGGVSVVNLDSGALPAGLGWLGVTAIVAGAVIIGLILRDPAVARGEREPGKGLLAAFFVPLSGVVAWIVWLGLSL